jgi:RHS repeat-associated protein
VNRAFDTDSKITQVDNASGASLKNYSYDDAFRITGIADAGSSALSWTYGYDSLDHLNSATSTGTTQGWTYDANGNRLTQTGTTPSTYTNSGASNRVSSISGSLPRTYGYDAAGNTLSYAGATFTYNNRGRMATATNGGVTATYTYNALGQRIRRTATSLTTLYVYDEAGHLAGEYTAAGALIQETVWLGDIPVATLRSNGSGGVIVYYVHADHLNTPRLVTDTSNNIRWRWDSDPFGTTIPNENPSGLGLLAYNLRFPGQQYDAVVGLHYNYFRDYDPAIGRYVESDPIGLAGGLNTFAYVDNEPTGAIDLLGLKKLSVDEVMKLIGEHNLSDLSAQLILCVIYKESTLDPSKKNPKKGSTATGLMGVTSAATQDMGIDHSAMTDGGANVGAGTRYLNRRVHWKAPFGGAGDVATGLAKYGEGKKYADSILECEKCLKKLDKCTDDKATLACLTPLHGGQ